MAKVTFAISSKFNTSIFSLILVTGLMYAIWNLSIDMGKTSVDTSLTLYLILGTALTTALFFEFINGFHDSANTIATVIYTYTLTPNTAVLWSAIWNFLGTLTSSGAVAYAIINLLPIDLLLQVGHNTGIAMVFALLFAAIIWNLSTWWLGLPASSSHTLIGSIIGIGLTNQLLTPHSGASQVDWNQALNIFQALLFSPLIGFISAGLLMLSLKKFSKQPSLYTPPSNDQPPPWKIRSLLIFTSAGVSFSHGLNDGQKGMGLVMLILVATVPTTYALNEAIIAAPSAHSFNLASQQAVQVLDKYTVKNIAIKDKRAAVMQMLIQHKITPEGLVAQKQFIEQIGKNILQHSRQSLNSVTYQTHRTRKDIYLANEALQLMITLKQPAFTPQDSHVIDEYRQQLNYATQYIPAWVKIIVAVTLGLGTMVGWKRIVTTVGEKIGETPINYAQALVTQLVTMLTITASSCFGLPVSTVHILSSAIAGTMVSHKIPLQWSIVRSILLTWIFTLPISILLAGGLFWLLLQCL